MVRIQAEQFGAVLQHEAQFAGDHAGTHAAEVALDQGHHIAVLIRDGKIDRVTRFELRVPRRQALRRLRRRDQLASVCGILLRDEPLDRNVGEVHVGVEPRPILVGELLRFDEKMDVLGAAKAHRPNIESLQDVEYLQGCDTLAARWQLVNVPAPVIRRHGRNPFGAVVREVLVAQQSALLRHESVDGFCDLAFIEHIAATFGDHLVGLRQPGVFEYLALFRRIAGRHVGCRETRVLLDMAPVASHVVGDHFGHRESVPRIPDCRGEDIGHRKTPIPVVQLVPAVNRARYANRQRPKRRNGIHAVFPKIFDGHRSRRASRRVEPGELLLLRIPDDGKQVATNTATGRFHQSECRVRCDSSVHGRAACLENIEGHLRCERLTSCRHTVRGDHLGAGCMGQPRNTIVGGETAGQDHTS